MGTQWILRFVSVTCVLAGIQSAVLAESLYSYGPIFRDAASFIGTGGGAEVSNSFALSSAAHASSITFGLAADPGTESIEVHWSIGTSFFDTSIAQGTALTSNAYFTDGAAFSQYLYQASFSVGDVALDAGTYYLTLSQASSPTSNLLHWTVVRSGLVSGLIDGQQRFTGAGPFTVRDGNAFTVFGTSVSAVPEPGSFALMVSGLLVVGGWGLRNQPGSAKTAEQGSRSRREKVWPRCEW